MKAMATKGWIVLALSGLVLQAGCSGPHLAGDEKRTVAVAKRYRANRDCDSLTRLISKLKLGMKRQEVEKLLGPPEYSPTEGQYYYGSDRRDDKGATMTLVVDYRVTEYPGDDIRTRLTDRLQSFFFGPVGE